MPFPNLMLSRYFGLQFPEFPDALGTNLEMTDPIHLKDANKADLDNTTRDI